MMDTYISERRRHTRYELEGQVFIAFRPDFDRLGWLMDISKGGISFECPVLQDYSELTEKQVSIDIFSAPRKFELSNLPCKLVYDARFDREKGIFKTIGTRRYGMVFDELPPQKAAQLAVVLTMNCKTT
jgi:hypothetical protein